MRLLVIEDGTEYEEFARLFLSDSAEIHAAHSAGEALVLLQGSSFDALLVDMRFERAPQDVLVGDRDEALRLFGGDRVRADRYLKDQQGTLVLAHLRAHQLAQPALFIHDFPARRLENLRKLYGRVDALPSFDAAAIRGWLEAVK